MIRKAAKTKGISHQEQINRRIIALLAALVFCFACRPVCADMPELPQPVDGVSPEDVDWSAVEEDLSDIAELALDEFAADDIPENYLSESENRGRVEKVYYITSGENETVKSVMVYYPAGYDESDRLYNILYLLHGSNGSPLSYLDPETPTKFQNLLVHLIADGTMEPIIVVAATYYPADRNVQQLPLA